MSLPNALTLIRILLIPLFVIFLISKSFQNALITFVIAGITDGLDGFIARIWNQRTDLGSYMDPIADKLLLASAFVTLAILRIIPSWLTVIIMSRDVLIALGFWVLTMTDHKPTVKPRYTSKITTVFQILTVIWALLSVLQWRVAFLFPSFIRLTAFLTILSGVHYIYIGNKLLTEK
ncbi:MAG: CDP-diacylglycerol--glycerol-3-phosphate 3-phosphatidyltransferase [Proteobacteria bacterium]|nr:CDP-diacylglycerol--glycerol-3-phosphate 3-phosphatidyltransferase [Pseudomonadota bacterium]